jgi:hypothetical protein
LQNKNKPSFTKFINPPNIQSAYLTTGQSKSKVIKLQMGVSPARGISSGLKGVFQTGEGCDLDEKEADELLSDHSTSVNMNIRINSESQLTQ